jgi:hypothetical protein
MAIPSSCSRRRRCEGMRGGGAAGGGRRKAHVIPSGRSESRDLHLRFCTCASAPALLHLRFCTCASATAASHRAHRGHGGRPRSASLRREFHAEGAEGCAEASHDPLGPRRTRGSAQGSRRRTIKAFCIVGGEERCASARYSTQKAVLCDLCALRENNDPGAPSDPALPRDRCSRSRRLHFPLSHTTSTRSGVARPMRPVASTPTVWT